jgi:hypothetical protein
LAVARDRVHAIARAVLWRTSKEMAAGELHLPPQRQQLLRMRFSAVEAFYYRRQHEACRTAVAALVNRVAPGTVPDSDGGAGDGPDAAGAAEPDPAAAAAAAAAAERQHVRGTQRLATSVSHNASAARLFSSAMLRLRQACCHPQVLEALAAVCVC